MFFSYHEGLNNTIAPYSTYIYETLNITETKLKPLAFSNSTLSSLHTHISQIWEGFVGDDDDDNHAGLDDTSLNMTDGHSTDTTNLVHILEREMEQLISGTSCGFNGIESIKSRVFPLKTVLPLPSY